MDRRLLGILSVAVLLALAGCAGNASPSAENQTASSALELDSVEYPNGFGQRGVTDSAAALVSHNESLADTGIIVHFSYQGAEQDAPTNITYQSSVRTGSVLMNCSSNCLRNASQSSYRQYIGESRSYLELQMDGRVVDQRNTDSTSTHSTLHRRTGTVGLARGLPTQNASTVDVFTRNNTTKYRYVYNNSSLVVRESGLIESFEDDGDIVSVRVYIRPAHGLELAPPRWAQQIERDRYDGGYGGYDDDTASSGCGSNDGDQSYDEDNDRDNDGLCDE